MTPLMLACSWGHVAAACLLLELGANETERDIHGNLPISMVPEQMKEQFAKSFNELSLRRAANAIKDYSTKA
jgi:ankyrin repeat protein